MSDDLLLDVRSMVPRERHPKIFDAWEALPVGGVLELVNDHDPKPLFYEFRAERSGEFEWVPVERGPERWTVRIKRVAAGPRVWAAGPRVWAAGRPSDGVAPAERPAWADGGGPALDVREDLRAGREPFAKIMEAVAGVEPGGVLVVRALFEPRPLYEVLKRQGFEAWSERLGEEDWKSYFRRAPRHGGCGCGHGAGHAERAGRLYLLDVSQLEPPEPMIEILSKVQELGPDDILEVSHHREPVPLYPQLEEAGFEHAIEKLAENRYRLRIWRKDA